MIQNLVQLVDTIIENGNFKSESINPNDFEKHIKHNFDLCKKGDKTGPSRLIYTAVVVLANNGEKEISQKYARRFENEIRLNI